VNKPKIPIKSVSFCFLILVSIRVFSTGSLANAQSSQEVKKMSKPPQTRVDDVVDMIHGQKVEDPYRWLENGESEEVRKWVNEQNT
jgi:prolyl oligopeptidase